MKAVCGIGVMICCHIMHFELGLPTFATAACHCCLPAWPCLLFPQVAHQQELARFGNLKTTGELQSMLGALQKEVDTNSGHARKAAVSGGAWMLSGWGMGGWGWDGWINGAEGGGLDVIRPARGQSTRQLVPLATKSCADTGAYQKRCAGVPKCRA